jgi:hypothetical protein
MPLHPRTRGNIEKFGFTAKLDGLRILPPVGYLEMLGLMRDAKLVLTDSGGIQEETTALGVPCLTLRDNTERPITVERRHQHPGRPRSRARSGRHSTTSWPAAASAGASPNTGTAARRCASRMR